MKKMVFYACMFFSLNTWAQQVYIKLGEAQTEKSVLAITEPIFLGNPELTSKYISLATTIREVLLKDLSVVGYFNMLPINNYQEIKDSGRLQPKELEKNGFDFEEYKKLGVDFLIKTGFFFDKKDLVIEVYAYHVTKSITMYANRYKGSLSSERDLLHTIADDFVYKVSGKRSFLTKKIAAIIKKPNEQHRELFIMDWDGKNLQQITSHKTIVLSPAWSKDGKKIAYTAFMQRKSNKARNADLFIYDFNKDTSQLVSYRKGINSGAFFEPSGTLLLTISTDANPDIYRIDLNGNIIRRLTEGPLGAINVEPTLSPDGQWIAFSSDRAGRPMIYIMDRDALNTPKRITFAGSFNAAPTWAPDSQTIAFAGFTDKAFDIYTIHRDGSNLKRITQAKKPNGKQASHENPDFSPDGRVIIYTSNRTGKNQIYMSLANGSEEWAITQDQLEYYQPRWSP